MARVCLLNNTKLRLSSGACVEVIFQPFIILYHILHTRPHSKIMIDNSKYTTKDKPHARQYENEVNKNLKHSLNVALKAIIYLLHTTYQLVCTLCQDPRLWLTYIIHSSEIKYFCKYLFRENVNHSMSVVVFIIRLFMIVYKMTYFARSNVRIYAMCLCSLQLVLQNMQYIICILTFYYIRTTQCSIRNCSSLIKLSLMAK